MAPTRLAFPVISREEILELAKDFGLTADIVEKDYALGWLLAGIGQHPQTRESWLFKGGTCLKKCFFETYRFSEDLDFTLLDGRQLDPERLAILFQEFADWVYEQCGLVLPPETRKVEVYRNVRGGKSAQGRIGYRGPLGRTGDVPRIKLDLTGDERVVLEHERREVHHPYTDRPAAGIHVATYPLEEVFAEKIRALAERLRPRDLYDVVHLFRKRELEPDRAGILAALTEKCAFKGIVVPTLELIQSSALVGELRSAWEQMLAHQLPALPSFESFWDELPAFFHWLFVGAPPVEMPAMRVASVGPLDLEWRPPNMAISWRTFGTSAPLEVVRFAAANRLCVELDYRDQQGTRRTRTIEPYSLRRSAAGNVLLFAAKADSGEPRSYRVDRIVGAAVSRRAFAPRFAVELTDTRPASAPMLGSSHASRASGARRGPTHTFRCPLCGKNFKRSSLDNVLRPHKGIGGSPCAARVGIFVGTEY